MSRSPFFEKCFIAAMQGLIANPLFFDNMQKQHANTSNYKPEVARRAQYIAIEMEELFNE